MKQWSDKLKLLSVLSTVKVLLSRSENDGFGLEAPKEAESIIDEIINCIFFNSQKHLPHFWGILFAPTGMLQEISLSNGWEDQFLVLSEEFDSLEYILKEYKK